MLYEKEIRKIVIQEIQNFSVFTGLSGETLLRYNDYLKQRGLK